MYKEITIQLTEQCNLQCPYCFAGDKSNNSITRENAQKFISYCNENRINSLKITGGEPFLYSEIYDFINSLSRDVQVLIFSNFTVSNCINMLPDCKCTILVNVNDRKQYTTQQWVNLNNNLRDARNRGFRIVLGKTFCLPPYKIEEVFSLAKEYQIKKIRFSQASPNKEKSNKWSNDEQTKNLYSYIHKSYTNLLKPSGIEIQFDCPVAPCVISPEIYEYFKKENCIKNKCKERLFIDYMLKIHHCYVTENDIGGDFLLNYSSYEDACIYIKKELINYRERIKLTKNCSVCKYNCGVSPCGCFALMERNEL